MVIDDLANRLHDCDLLLDQNFYADMSLRYTGKVPALCRLLLGPRYALLRDEFRQLHEQAKSCSEPVKRVLVFFGGIDSDNYTDLAIEAVANINIPDLQVDVVIGAQHPCRAQIEEKCIQHGFFCHVQTNRMAELMAEADLSIGAGGSTVWERCCMGLPTFAIRTAENQRKQLIDAAVEGLLYTTKTGDDPLDTIKRHLQVLLENTSLRSLISRNSLQAVDGRGISRIVRALECSTLSIRFAELPDSENLFLWRNHPTIRDASFNAEPILWKDHQEWMKAVLSSKDKLLLIGERFNTPVGVIRFDLRGEEADVSIYLVPGIDEPGLGSSLLRSAELWLADTHPDICKILAKVLGFNKKSQNLFLGHKYEVESICYSKRQNLNEFRN
jgi:spore coat polysaccharide biosynthesis predicted glycosyltransferase SpsG/RimJ/RimL family protein N-acetyltransferase